MVYYWTITDSTQSYGKGCCLASFIFSISLKNIYTKAYHALMLAMLKSKRSLMKICLFSGKKYNGKLNFEISIIPNSFDSQSHQYFVKEFIDFHEYCVWETKTPLNLVEKTPIYLTSHDSLCKFFISQRT